MFLLDLSLHFPRPDLESTTFLKKPGSFEWKTVFKIKLCIIGLPVAIGYHYFYSFSETSISSYINIKNYESTLTSFLFSSFISSHNCLCLGPTPFFWFQFSTILLYYCQISLVYNTSKPITLLLKRTQRVGMAQVVECLPKKHLVALVFQLFSYISPSSYPVVHIYKVLCYLQT
jgi:hypothetical protein